MFFTNITAAIMKKFPLFNFIMLLLLSLMLSSCDGNTQNLADNEQENLLIGNESTELQPLTGTSWHVEKLSGITIPGVVDIRKLTLLFKANTVAGFSGCNNFQNKYVLEEQKITFLPVASTMRECLDSDKVIFESAFLKLLAKVDTFQLNSERLVLIVKGSPVIVMQPL